MRDRRRSVPRSFALLLQGLSATILLCSLSLSKFRRKVIIVLNFNLSSIHIWLYAAFVSTQSGSIFEKKKNIIGHHYAFYCIPWRKIPQDSIPIPQDSACLTSHAVTFMHAPTLITNTNAPYPES